MPLRLFLLLAFLCPPQDGDAPLDPPKITVEKTGDFHELVDEIAKKLSIKIKIQEEVSRKEIKASMRDAGLFEALDTLCRAHGQVTYFRSGGDRGRDRDVSILELEPGKWKDYPVHYSGHYKTIVSLMVRVRRHSDRGGEGCVQLELCTFAPPWHELGFPSGFTRWMTTEAVTPDGRRVLGAWGTGDLLSLRLSSDMSGNISTQNLELADFDPATGLAALGGKAAGTMAAYKVVRVSLEAGKTVEIPGGSLTVDTVSLADKDEAPAHRWRITFTLNPSERGEKPPSERILERRVRFDGDESWDYAIYSGRGPSYEIDTPYLKRAPDWMEFRVKMGERKVEVPYRFTDLKWKDE